MISKILVLCMLATLALCMPQGVKESYKPYSFSYDVDDSEGNLHGHSENQDADGVVTGQMYILLNNGLLRQVSYVATSYDGFRLILDSNEPGLGDASPANAEFNIRNPPARI